VSAEGGLANASHTLNLAEAAVFASQEVNQLLSLVFHANYQWLGW